MSKRTFAFNKLIRNKMYDSMKEKGAIVELVNIKTKKDLINCFKKKLLEEADEVSTAESYDDILEELADCVEVINGFTKALNISLDELEKIRKSKREVRGGFDIPIMVNTITVSAKDTEPSYYKFFIKYCEAAASKYPEITKACHKDDLEKV